MCGCAAVSDAPRTDAAPTKPFRRFHRKAPSNRCARSPHGSRRRWSTLGDPRLPIRSRSFVPHRGGAVGPTSATGFTTSKTICRPGSAVRSRCARINAHSTARRSDSRIFVFDTGGPSIRTVAAVSGRHVDEDQLFLLALDAEAIAATIEHAAYCAIEGLAERVPVRVLTATNAKRSSRSAVSSATATTRFSGRTAPGLPRACATVRSKPLKAGWWCSPANGNCRRTQNCSSSGAPASKHRAESQPRSTSCCRSRCAPLSPRICNAAASTPGPAAFHCEPISLQFSAPVPAAAAAAIRIVGANGVTKAPEPAAGGVANVEFVAFAPPFPEQTTMHVELPAGLADDVGRPLANADRFPLDVDIDAYPPLAKFSGAFGILEGERGCGVAGDAAQRGAATAGAACRPAGQAPARDRRRRRGGKLAAAGGSSQRTDADRGAYDEATQRSVWTEQTADHSVFTPADPVEQFVVPGAVQATNATARPLEVVGIPLAERGFYVVELESRRLGEALLGRDQPRYVATVRAGDRSQRAFQMGTRIVARVGHAPERRGAGRRPRCRNHRLLFRRAALARQNRSRRDRLSMRSFGEPHGNGSCGYAPMTPLMVSARSADDFSFMLSSWNEGIRPYDFALRVGGEWQAAIFHTVTDRPLLRAGETVSMKHFLRRHSVRGVDTASALPGTRKVRVTHRGSGTQFEFDAAFDSNRHRRIDMADSQGSAAGRLLDRDRRRRHLARKRSVQSGTVPTSDRARNCERPGGAAAAPVAGSARCPRELPVRRQRGGAARQTANHDRTPHGPLHGLRRLRVRWRDDHRGRSPVRFGPRSSSTTSLRLPTR